MSLGLLVAIDVLAPFVPAWEPFHVSSPCGESLLEPSSRSRGHGYGVEQSMVSIKRCE